MPGIGARGAYRITEARKYGALDFDNLAKMRIILKRAKHFITCKGKFYGSESANAVTAALMLDGVRERQEQISMFSSPSVALSALSGEI